MSGATGPFTIAAPSASDTQYDAGTRRIELLGYSPADAAFLGRVTAIIEGRPASRSEAFGPSHTRR